MTASFSHAPRLDRTGRPAAGRLLRAAGLVFGLVACNSLTGVEDLHVAPCIPTGESCGGDADCCSNTTGGLCTPSSSGQNSCADACKLSSDCKSGCCASVRGAKVCASLSQCTNCKDAGFGCKVNGDCCNFDKGEALCVSTGAEVLCHATCNANTECVSNCCFTLKDSTTKTCGAPNLCGSSGGG